MSWTESEYQAARERVAANNARLQEHERHLRQQGLKAEEIKRALDPLRSFFLQTEEEVDGYEDLRRRPRLAVRQSPEAHGPARRTEGRPPAQSARALPWIDWMIRAPCNNRASRSS